MERKKSELKQCQCRGQLSFKPELSSLWAQHVLGREMGFFFCSHFRNGDTLDLILSKSSTFGHIINALTHHQLSSNVLAKLSSDSEPLAYLFTKYNFYPFFNVYQNTLYDYEMLQKNICYLFCIFISYLSVPEAAFKMCNSIYNLTTLKSKEQQALTLTSTKEQFHCFLRFLSGNSLE